MNSLRRTGRVAAIMILVLVVVAPVGLLLPTSLIVPGDAGATVENITRSETLFRVGLAAQALVFLIEIALPIVLYVLLKAVNKTLSLIAASARVGMAVVQAVNVINHLAVLLLVSGTRYLTVFASEELEALVLFFLNLHSQVELVWGLFFAFHLAILGYLVIKADYMAKFLGGVLLVASACYVVSGFGKILLPRFAGVYAFMGYVSIIELVFPLWLLIRGVRDEPEAAAAG